MSFKLSKNEPDDLIYWKKINVNDKFELMVFPRFKYYDNKVYLEFILNFSENSE